MTIHTLIYLAHYTACWFKRFAIGSLLIALSAVVAMAGEFRLIPSSASKEGLVGLTVIGDPPAVFWIECSQDLVSWQRLATNVLVARKYEFQDTTASSALGCRRFYRAVLSDEPPYMPGELLISFKQPVSAKALSAAIAHGGISELQPLTSFQNQVPGDSEIYLAKTELDVHQATVRAILSADIDHAEPNWIRSSLAVPNDPLLVHPGLWGMHSDKSTPANSFGSHAVEAWKEGYTGSPDVVIGLIDEGVQIAHPDLQENIWTNPREIPGNGIDDDRNGYTDDIHGYNFNVGNADVSNADVEEYHGSHTAGTIGARGDNNIGVVGVNWHVRILPVKFLGERPATTDKLIKAIDYVTDLKRNYGVNIVAVNNSYGYLGCNPAPYSRFEHEAIIRAAKENILWVCAAGNDNCNNDSVPEYPANYDTTKGTASTSPAPYNSVISVAALDRQGQLAPFSNFGKTTVALGAPGVSVLSTVPENDYAIHNGTSMAAPHVTGALALYASTHPNDTAAQIREAMLLGATRTESLVGKIITAGRLDLSNVIRPNIHPVVEAPGVVNPECGTLRASPRPSYVWTAVARATSYILRVFQGTSSTPVRVYEVENATEFRPAEGDVLPNGETFRWEVAGRNALGEGPASDTCTFTVRPADAGVVEAPGVVNPECGTLRASPRPSYVWTAVARATSYILRVFQGTSSTPVRVYEVENATEFRPAEGDVLPNGETFRWEVAGRNALGEGPASDTCTFTVRSGQ